MALKVERGGTRITYLQLIDSSSTRDKVVVARATTCHQRVSSV